MMIKRNLGILASAVVAASGAQAAFDPGNAVLFAYDTADDDTYFVDLGVTGADLVGSTTVDLTSAGLSAWIAGQTSVQWTVLSVANIDLAPAGPPGANATLENSGIVGTGDGTSAVGDTATYISERQGVLDWLASVAALDGDNDGEVAVLGVDAESSDFVRNASFLSNSLISLGATSSLWYAKLDSDSAANPISINQVGTADTLLQSAAFLDAGTGQFTANVAAVPVPAAAWLFGSALLGLGVVRRK